MEAAGNPRDDGAAPASHAPNGLGMRYFGEQVLRRPTRPLAELPGGLAELESAMLATMEEEGGIGLAAPQVGRSERLFVHCLADTGVPAMLINPTIVEARGEWVYQEGCLSIPGLYFELVRPKELLVRALTREGREIEFEADELFARLCQHELDHLDGILMVDRLDDEQRSAADLELRRRVSGTLGVSDPFLTGAAVKGVPRRRALPL